MAKKPTEKSSEQTTGCTCLRDAFAALPPEARPPAPIKNSNLRKVTCPGCGLRYTTNRDTDLCMTCAKTTGQQDG